MFQNDTSRQRCCGILVAAILALCCAPEASAQVRTRRNYRTLEPDERKKFRNAVVAMKAATYDTGALGVCSVAGTFVIISKPTKIASTKTVSEVMKSIENPPKVLIKIYCLSYLWNDGVLE